MASGLPSVMRKVVVKSLSVNFREAIEVTTCALPKLKAQEVLVKNRFVGINASDINFTAGRYDPTQKPPFDAGFEAVGEIVATGDRVSSNLLGQSVAHLSNGAFSEYQAVSSERLFPIKSLKPVYLPCLVSGLTAKLALQSSAHLKAGETVLVTAAAGGTGQFAVQLAKLAGCHVIGTCSTNEKVDFLKRVGCDHAINISKEDLKHVLRTTYPKGIDVVYESVGGETYETCVNSLANKGRLIVIGYISGYQDPMGVGSLKFARAAAALPVKLLTKSACVHGFFLFHYADQWKDAFLQLSDLLENGQLTSTIDLGKSVSGEGFKGIDAIADAVDYLYSKKSIGKIVVDLEAPGSSKL
ncbi:prostaglandin reductase-3-like [Clavelina lepadiformis]|uniref:prostaglandin reductase-3-like n=1 Tax=Clavelina lepadiformis TaxID=159417 RepID=UPI004042FD3E